MSILFQLHGSLVGPYLENHSYYIGLRVQGERLDLEISMASSMRKIVVIPLKKQFDSYVSIE